MKINGKVVSIREIVEVVLHRSSDDRVVKLKVSGYPIGISKRYELINPKPTPPLVDTGVTKVGRPPETAYNYKDLNYIKAYEDWLALEQYYIICKCLEVDTSVVFEANCNTVEGLRAIPTELNDAGFTEADVGKILEAIKDATNIPNKVIEEAAKNF